MAEIIQLRVRCHKCRPGSDCVYCAGQGSMTSEIAVALRKHDREVSAMWCDCTDPAAEVTFNRYEIRCAVCNRVVQEDIGFGRGA